MNEMELVIPALPNMKLSTNQRDRLHHMERARITKAENARWYGLILGSFPPVPLTMMFPWQKAELSWELSFPTKRLRDEDNIKGALKVIQDTLCVAQPQDAALKDPPFRLGLIVNDSPDCLVDGGLITSVGFPLKDGRTIIRLREISGD